MALPYLSDGFALARWITGSATDAEDVVQDACLRAFRGIDGYAGGNARAWFLTIVRNAAYTWLRKNRPPEVIGVDDVEALERSGPGRGCGAALPQGNPEAVLLARIDGLRLQAAILKLDAVFREVLILREVHGLEYREIAAVTGAPIGTVMSRLARARRRVLEQLTEDDA